MKAQISKILKLLFQEYPHPECALIHKDAFELLIATILSAQCTDERVNKITPALFKIAGTAELMNKISQDKLEILIHSAGFYKNKAKSIKGAAKAIVKNYDGKVPNSMEELIKLPGVGRKTANVILGTIWGISEGIVVDTHVLRLSHRLNLAKYDNPEKVEKELMKIIPKKSWIDFAHALVLHGRKYCMARSPNCIDCPLNKICPFFLKNLA